MFNFFLPKFSSFSNWNPYIFPKNQCNKSGGKDKKMKMIEVAYYLPNGEIKIDSGIFEKAHDAHQTPEQIIAKITKDLANPILADFALLRVIRGYYSHVARFRVVGCYQTAPCTNRYVVHKVLSDFIPIETKQVSCLREKVKNGEFNGVPFNELLCFKHK